MMVVFDYCYCPFSFNITPGNIVTALPGNSVKDFISVWIYTVGYNDNPDGIKTLLPTVGIFPQSQLLGLSHELLMLPFQIEATPGWPQLFLSTSTIVSPLPFPP